MKPSLRRMLLAIAIALPVWAQAPVVAPDGIFNAASLLDPTLPNGDLAQGTLFSVLLTKPLPIPSPVDGSFPLKTTWNGLSLRITVGSINRSAYVLGLVDAPPGTRILAMLPSATPVGPATLTVTYNGQSSEPVTFHVVASAFAWFTQNSLGTGPGDFTDSKYKLYAPDYAANPGDFVSGWGTGLRGITGNETSSPRFGDLTVAKLTLWVGDKAVTPIYTGRSGCCAGMDQINFTVPEGVAGCAVPIVMQIGDEVSNAATMPIAASGRVCSDPHGFTGAEIQTLITKKSLNVGGLTLDRTNQNGALTDTIAGDFRKVDLTASPAAIGTCSVSTFRTGVAAAVQALDAGSALRVTGALGAKDIPKTQPGSYLLQAALASQPAILLPGSYALQNADAGKDVALFKTTGSFPGGFIWMNEASVSPVQRSQGLTVSWAGGDPTGFVAVEGSSTTGSVGARFSCTVPANFGQFTVPPSVLLALPAGPASATNILSVKNQTAPTRFAATGLDLGFVRGSLGYSTTVEYR